MPNIRLYPDNAADRATLSAPDLPAFQSTALGADDRALWRLPPDLGRRYAGVSGDANPIHLSPLTSRLFGFPRPIIHGMWTHARALAQLDARLPDAYRVQVRFTRPIMLPAAVTFAAETADAPWFVVRSREGRAHLIGRVSEPDAA